jgi:hypothetical protein
MSARLKIITAYDPGFAHLGNICAKSIRLYCASFGYDYHIYTEMSSGRHPQWEKIKLLIDELKAGSEYEYFLWIDADACFVRGDKDILEFDQDLKDINLVNHNASIMYTPPDLPGVHLVCERPNTGVILVKNTQWSTDFLIKCWNDIDCIDHFWRDNAAVMKALGFTWEISGFRERNNFNLDILNNVTWLDVIWNSVPTISQDGRPCISMPMDPVILHCAGMPDSLRSEFMKKLYFKSTPLS